jgi:hypothetical protein
VRLASAIERSIVRLDLDRQAELVSLINALNVQLESGRPDATVVRLLGEAPLALAHARGLSPGELDLVTKLGALDDRV